MAQLKTLCMAASFALAGSTAFAETDLEAALNNGAERLNADQIAELLIGNTVTATSGEKRFRFFYDPNNVVSGELTNGGWSGAGAFAITDTDKVCVSMAADNGRYRCMTVLRIGDSIQKFSADGKKLSSCTALNRLLVSKFQFQTGSDSGPTIFLTEERW